MKHSFIAACLTALIAAPQAMATTPAAPALEVRSITVIPGAAGPEVVIAVDDGVEIEDFTLESPHRVVIDFKGAILSIPANFYDKVNRGGITNIRAAQYAPGTVRIVIETDAVRPHQLARRSNELRVLFTGTTVPFSPWFSASQASRDRAAAAAEAPAERPLQLTSGAVQSAQPRITVAYQDADIRDVIAAFASFSGRTIVIGKDVTTRSLPALTGAGKEKRWTSPTKMGSAWPPLPEHPSALLPQCYLPAELHLHLEL